MYIKLIKTKNLILTQLKIKKIDFFFIFAKFQMFDSLFINVNNENKILNIFLYFVLFFKIVKIR